MQKRRISIKTVVIVGLILFLLIFAKQFFLTVKAGHNEVATLFGKINPVPYGEGFHIVNPLLRFTSFDLRQQTNTWTKVQVPSQDKLKTSMDVSVTFKIDGGRTPVIYQETGRLEDVIVKHITPKVRSLLREAGKTVKQSQDFYLDTVQQQMQIYMEDGLRSYLEPKGVLVQAVLFRDITLPSVVTSAVIQTKERQEQLEREVSPDPAFRAARWTHPQPPGNAACKIVSSRTSWNLSPHYVSHGHRNIRFHAPGQ